MLMVVKAVGEVARGGMWWGPFLRNSLRSDDLVFRSFIKKGLEKKFNRVGLDCHRGETNIRFCEI